MNYLVTLMRHEDGDASLCTVDVIDTLEDRLKNGKGGSALAESDSLLL